MKRSARTTISDIASECGVTPMTVSYAFSGKQPISEATRQRVLECAQRLNYEPNVQARRLRSGETSNTIGLFIPLLHSGTATQRVRHIHGLLAGEGFELPVYTQLGESDSGSQVKMLRDVCLHQPAAIVYQNQFPEQAELYPVFRGYMQRGGVVVAMTRDTDIECDQVIYDYADAAVQATRHLYELGHRKIGLYWPYPDSAPQNKMYFSGYERALRELGLEQRADWILSGPVQHLGGEPLAQQLLQMNDRPTAVIVENDAVAAVAVNFLLRSGVRVPEDISIVGFDDTLMASTCVVPLTAVRQPVEKIAQAVSSMLLDRLKHGYAGAPRRVVIKGELVCRESAAAI